MTESKTVCDMCGSAKPDEYKLQKEWAYVRVDINVYDFCPSCWSPVRKVLLRNFVDGLMLEAQGIKEEA